MDIQRSFSERTIEEAEALLGKIIAAQLRVKRTSASLNERQKRLSKLKESDPKYKELKALAGLDKLRLETDRETIKTALGSLCHASVRLKELVDYVEGMQH